MMNNNKVLQIEIAGKGGICHYTYNLVKALSKLKKVALITGINYELEDKERSFELIGIFNRFKTNPLGILKLIKIFKDKEVRIIHFQVSQHPVFILLLCYLAKIFTDKKIIITAHNIVSHEEKKWERNIYKRFYALADRVIVHAQANKLEIKQNFAIDTGKIDVIPHGNYGFFNEGEKEQTLSENTFNILFFGYIRKYKGLIYLIRALRLIKEKIPQVKLFVVGRAVEDFSRYQKEINNLGLENNVEISLNYIPFEKVKEYFRKTNVVVLPYLNIYQSGILQLAYGLGRPVVATSVGGLREAVEDGRTGFIVPPMDVESLAEKIVAILSNRELQQKMGDHALHLAQTKFSWDTIATKTLELYKSMDN